jgi:hypothetical protein
VNLLCLDVGSTWTKGALVSPAGELLGTAQHVTTPPEVMTGLTAVVDALDPRAEVLACSSAGGGLRLAVVGQERLISAEAGYRVALSAGARVVHVFAGRLSGPELTALRAARPDVVLLVGGTDGGEEKVLLHNASRLARNRVRVPIVLAGNVKARDEALSLLAGRTVVVADNVLPDVGELAPDPARRAIREVFLSHVIGGKHLSRSPRLRHLVRTVTPDAVLTGVARLSRHVDGPVLVVDVGGATTDVYSALPTAVANSHAVALPPDRRTVEGDIGLRHSAPNIITEAIAENLLPATPAPPTGPAHLAAAPAAPTGPAHLAAAPAAPTGPAHLAAAPAAPTGPAHLAAAPAPPTGPAHLAAGPAAAPSAALPRSATLAAEPDPLAAVESTVDYQVVALAAEATRLAATPGTVRSTMDTQLSTLAAIIALRRHLRLVEDLGPTGAALLVLSGGAFRHAAPGHLTELTAALRADPTLRAHLRATTVIVDHHYTLAPAGLLASAGHLTAADRLLAGHLLG